MTKEGPQKPLTDLEFLRIIYHFQWSTTSQLSSYISYNRQSIFRRIHKLENY